MISHKGEILENRFDRKIEYVKKAKFQLHKGTNIKWPDNEIMGNLKQSC